MENDKYVVFKASHFNDWRAGRGPKHRSLTPFIIDDAIVIRRQDIFAGPGLYAYANAIQTAIDLMSIDVGVGPDGIDPRLRHLEELRDFFVQQAMMAVDHEMKKIPD